MAKISMSTKVNVSADQLWRVIGGFNALPAWHPAIEKSDSDGETRGSVRKLKIAGGGEVVERLDHVGEDERVYVYSILDSPLPVTNYVAELRVRDNKDGSSTVEWSSNFLPSGTPEADAMKMVQGIYQAGFDNLKKMFGG
jgi:hypothetical protein